MTAHDPTSAVPPPLAGRRDPGDAWVEAATGERYWGRFGAAGLLVASARESVLLQHRAAWSHHGGTWGIPGGALHQGEEPYAGALREAREEAGVPHDRVAPVATFVVDREVWRYTTVVARTETEFAAVAGDSESLELRWVPVAEVHELPLHPAFGRAWPRLLAMLAVRPAVIIDAANVVGATPDGWWRDRAASSQRFASRLEEAASRGVAAAELDLDGDRWNVAFEMVVEGQARDTRSTPAVMVTAAPADGDATIVERVHQRVAQGERVTVVTSDRELARRARASGARTVGASWALRVMGQSSHTEPAARHEGSARD